MKKKKIEEDMSNTFVLEVGQKSAIFDDMADDGDDGLEDVKNEEVDDDFFDKPKRKKKNKNKKQKKKVKKNNGFITTILMILCIGIGVGLSYCYYEVYGNNSSKDNKNAVVLEDNEEELLPDGVFSTSLVESYDAYNSNSSDIYNSLYSKDEIKVKDISLDYVKDVVVRRALYFSEDYSNISFSKDNFDRALKELFGDKVSISDDDVAGFKYDSKSKKYTYDEDREKEENDYKLDRKVVKSIKKKNSIEINVAVLFTSANKVYKTPDDDSVIDGVKASDFDIDKDYTKLNQYKYTFNYDKSSDNYILDSIELIK